ncbi:MAG TPA: DNA-processing protein DprA, partial [bacterium]|nr:DNA-processing protein DprA [bacterium]
MSLTNRPHNDRNFDLLRLIGVHGMGHIRLRNLIRHFGSPTSALSAPAKSVAAVHGMDLPTAERIKLDHEKNIAFAKEQMRRMHESSANLLTFSDEAYPELLKQSESAPYFLFVRGAMTAEDAHAIAIVGTRQPTAYGRAMAEKLSQELAQRGITVVSGLARGIDTAAHTAAMRCGGRTIAVLGSGVDHIYPRENDRLAIEISNRGAVISEYPMGTGPDAAHFPGRNRIISGLSLGTVVIEAGEKSGALITADYALDQNREVFAVPGLATNPHAKGSNRLIRSGAKLVETVDDILQELEG